MFLDFIQTFMEFVCFSYILHSAEVAEVVFNKCIQDQRSSHSEHPQLTFDFEFLDDFHPLPVTSEVE